KRSIGALRGDRGAVLARGVMVAPLAPGRALPVRYTFVVGAGEGAVPDTTPRSPLDLRGADVKRGDVSRGDRDRYAFLECVLAARGVAVPEPPALADLLARAPLPRLRAALRLGAAAELIERAPDRDRAPELITLSLSAVRRFLEAPAQAWAQVVLRLDDVDAE